ncbi:MAG: tRNA (adenosine(37)-N6)-threonylcarbamoyltransferase complex transferase subunit TsaD [Bdellovibrionales bacterium]
MAQIQRVLAVETSCDDTSVAIVEADGKVLFCESANQDIFHKPFGGIVPEIAGRNHTEKLLPLMEKAFVETGLTWKDIGGLVVTSRPGLVGSLLVGVVTVKSIALAKGLPFLGVNHLEGHILAPFLRDEKYQPPSNFDFPFVALAVSGGHSSLYHVEGLGQYTVIGRTIDDAAGEAFDKFAKMVGLGFPGGVHVDRLAKQGDRMAFPFPRAMLGEDVYDFSFSGLKSAASRLISSMKPQEVSEQIEDLCASYQEAIVEVLMRKLELALQKTKLKKFIITGGVSANSRLREAAEELGMKNKYQWIVPPMRYCTDNAAMIGYVGIQRMNKGERADSSLGVSPEVTL